MTALTAPISRSLHPAIDRGGSAVGRPWMVVAFVVLCFILANHDWRASLKWKAGDTGGLRTMESGIEQGQVLRQAAFVTLGAVSVLSLLLPSRRAFRVDLLIAYPLILLCIWVTLSVLWSQAPALTAKRLVIFFAMLSAALALLRTQGMGLLVWLSFAYGAASLLIAVPNELLIGSNPLEPGYRFAGTTHPNSTGLQMVLLMLASVTLAGEGKRRWFWAVAVLAFLALLATRSRTALIAGTTAVAVLIALRWPLRRLLLVGLPMVWIGLTFATLYSMDLVPPIWEKALLAREDSDPTTLTGRTDIWKFALHQLARDPQRIPIGFGYDTFWTPEMVKGVSTYVRFTISEGHSAYIDGMLTVGAIGAGLYVWLLLAMVLRWAWFAWQSKAAVPAFAAAIGVTAMIHGTAESAFIQSHLWTLVLFSSMAFAGFARSSLPRAGASFAR